MFTSLFFSLFVPVLNYSAYQISLRLYLFFVNVVWSSMCISFHINCHTAGDLVVECLYQTIIQLKKSVASVFLFSLPVILCLFRVPVFHSSYRTCLCFVLNPFLLVTQESFMISSYFFTVTLTPLVCQPSFVFACL